MTLKDKLKQARTKPKPKRPVWKGPEVDGVTQSLLSRFLVCRERFRVLVVEGLRPADQFNHRIEYGNMWHVCEEHFSSEGLGWEYCLKEYCQGLCQEYSFQQIQIRHWFNVCKVQFPIYVDYWAKHSDEKHCTPLLQEQAFNVPYELPSGRVVRLRGKWDGVDLLGRGRSAGIFLGENKTKGDLKEDQITRQLQFDLQTMLYLVGLQESLADYAENGSDGFNNLPDQNVFGEKGVSGISYNCVRRPLSGGKGSIRQHKATGKKPAETEEHFYQRLGGIIAEDPGYFFMRWKVEVTSMDIERFKREFLTPILEGLCDWWEWIGIHEDPFDGASVNPIHWRTPFGFYNVLAEGGSSELDEYLGSGSELGLERTDNLFRELE